MKKVIIIFAIVVLAMLVFSFAGCAPKEEAVPQENQEAVPQENQAEAAAPVENSSEAPAEEDSSEAVWELNLPLSLEYYEEGAGPVFEFTTVNLEGEEVDQSIFQGNKVTMINIWGTFCPSCISSMPDLGRLAEDYADKGFGIVGVVHDVMVGDEELITEAEAIATESGADYNHLLMNDSVISAMFKGVKYIPTTYFVDESGTCIAKAIIGANSYDRWATIVEELLAR